MREIKRWRCQETAARSKQPISCQGLSPVLVPASSPFAAYKLPVRGSVDVQQSFAAGRCEDALLASFASQLATKKQFEEMGATETWSSEDVSSEDDVYMDSVEEAFAQLSEQLSQVSCHACPRPWCSYYLRGLAGVSGDAAPYRKFQQLDNA